MKRAGIAAMLLALILAPGCGSEDSPAGLSAEISQAIRQVMSEWELGIETNDIERVEAVFDERYWPGELITPGQFNNLASHELRLLDIEIQIRVQQEYADVSFRVYVEDAPEMSFGVVWVLRESLGSWLVIEEDWTSYR